MDKYFKTVSAPKGGRLIWNDNSPASVILNNEFFSNSPINKFWIKISGVWKECITWIKVSGIWKQATPKIKITGNWR